MKKYKNEPFQLFVSKNVDGTSKLEVGLEERVDREVMESYSIQMIAKDSGSPPKENVLNVHISVTDINDNAPVFSQNVYNVSAKNEPREILPII